MVGELGERGGDGAVTCRQAGAAGEGTGDGREGGTMRRKRWRLAGIGKVAYRLFRNAEAENESTSLVSVGNEFLALFLFFSPLFMMIT